MIEKVSGETYADYLTKHVFAPLGMKDTGYDVSATILRHRASGYKGTKDGWRNADYLDMTLPYAAGSLYSTTGDLLIWDRALTEGKMRGAGHPAGDVHRLRQPLRVRLGHQAGRWA